MLLQFGCIGRLGLNSGVCFGACFRNTFLLIKDAKWKHALPVYIPLLTRKLLW